MCMHTYTYIYQHTHKVLPIVAVGLVQAHNTAHALVLKHIYIVLGSEGKDARSHPFPYGRWALKCHELGSLLATWH